MTEQPNRCPAVAPPQIAADAARQLARYHSANPTLPDARRDWRCVRGEHDQAEQHAAMPLGIAGFTIRFESDPPVTRADLDELLARPGVAVVKVEHGDELLLLMPHDDTGTAERAAMTLAELYPSVSWLVLAGVTGAVVMPRRDGCPPACGEGHTYAPGCEQYVRASDDTTAAAPEQGDAAADQPSRADQLVDELRAADEYDGRLIDGLAELGRQWGPYGVARAAAFLTDTTLARDADVQPGPAEPTPEAVCKCPTGPCGHDRERAHADRSPASVQPAAAGPQ